MNLGISNAFLGGFSAGGPILDSVSAFATRVAADSGTTEATDCLTTRISTLYNLGLWEGATTVWFPHGIKANKIYAVKGDSGADLSFTRVGTKTRKASSLIETVATGIPALDYTGSTCPALSLEPARTNLIYPSEEMDDSLWSKSGVTVTANNATAPNGATLADTILETTANSNHRIVRLLVKAANSLTYTFSVYVKLVNRDWVVLHSSDGTNGFTKYFNLTTGTEGSVTSVGTGYTYLSSTITAAPNGYHRISITYTTTTSTNLYNVVQSASADGTDIFIGNAASGFIAWGAQLEQASHFTSYIPTNTGTITRIADTVNPLTTATALIGQTAGAIYFEGNSFADNTNKYITVSDGTANNRVSILFSNTNTIIGQILVAGVSQAAPNFGAFTTGTNYKICISYAVNNVFMYINGSLVGSVDISATIPACSQIHFGLSSGTNPFYGNLKGLALYNSALTEVQAAAITTP